MEQENNQNQVSNQGQPGEEKNNEINNQEQQPGNKNAIEIERITEGQTTRYFAKDLSQVNNKRINDILKPHCSETRRDTKAGTLKFMFIGYDNPQSCAAYEKRIIAEVKEELDLDVTFTSL